MAGLSKDIEEVVKTSHDPKTVAGSVASEKHSDIEIHHEADDGLYDGLEFPTEHEIATLRRVPDTIPLNTYLIAFVELAERFSYYGSSVVFTNFIQYPLPPGSRTGAGGRDGQSGALGMRQRASTGLTTFYLFWCYVTPLAGAYLADARWGRFNTVCVAVFIALIGHVIMTISSVPGVIEKKGAIGVFILSLIVTGLGTGLFKANISPLVAEQYRRSKLCVKTTKTGERVIIDPALTISRVYMYFYLFINIGALVGQIGMTYSEKYVGFWLAYTLPTIVFLLCPFVLFAGRNRYTRSPPTSSVLEGAFRLFLYAARSRWSFNPVTLYKNFTAPGFWDNAKPSKQVQKPPWMTFDDQWVDEVNRGLKACAVCLWFPLYWITYNQLYNNLTSQAATLTTNGLPNDVLSNLDPFALIILIPVCDLLIYPGFRRMGINFTPLKKITAGFFTGSAAMVWAAVVQYYIYKTNPCGDQASSCTSVSPLTVWIQAGCYILIAISEILALITGLEYAFTKAPKNMRSLVMAVFLFTAALSAAIGEAFVSLSADPLLVWNYGTMAVLSFLSGVAFWYSVRSLDRREEELNNLPEGHLVSEKN